MEASESQAKRRGAPLKNPEEKKTAQEGYYRDYARAYYRKNFCKSVECPNCGKFVNVQKLRRHQTSHLCISRSSQSGMEEKVS